MNGNLLNVLSLLISLSLRVREAHWNIRGARFISIHTFLGGYYDSLDGFIDQIAERISQLGGGPTTKHESSKFPGRNIDGALDAIQSDSNALRDEASAAVILAMKTEDHGTADLLIRFGEMLDKNIWFIASERGESPTK